MFKAIKEWFAKREAVRRRSNYDFLKGEIIKRHLSGLGGMRVKFKGRKFDLTDLQAFPPPMYQIAKDEQDNFCLFWRKDLMSEEIGEPSTTPQTTNADPSKP